MRPGRHGGRRGGSVPFLPLVNPLDARVLLYEGEELVGAKQNRILESTILAKAGAKLDISVACVEAAAVVPLPPLRAAAATIERQGQQIGAQ